MNTKDMVTLRFEGDFIIPLYFDYDYGKEMYIAANSQVDQGELRKYNYLLYGYRKGFVTGRNSYEH